MSGRALRIGIDFDNTIAGYDRAFAAAAARAGMLPPGTATTKHAVREALRAQPDGETAWQHLQGIVYGTGMGEAELIAGVAEFLRQCRQTGAAVAIVSHKTRVNALAGARVDLREAAWGWMETKGFFRGDGMGLARANVHFEDTRADKLARIAALRCTHFIDDLEEVFREPGFPAGVTRCLFAPGRDTRPGPYESFASWREITSHVFGLAGAAR
jgi:hypothetical protein